MKKILFVNGAQFGYLTDVYKYCQYLKDQYHIEYICFDKHMPKIIMDGLRVDYIPYIGPKFFRGILYVMLCITKCLFFKGTIFVIYFPKCYLLKKILFWKKMHLDIRSMSVSNSDKIRNRINKDIQKAINVYDSLSFISEGIKNKSIIPRNKQINILPLGSDVISESPKAYKKLKLLYVGTLTNRKIIDTVIGLKKILEKNPKIDIIYDIVGAGEDFDKIQDYIRDNNLCKYIQLHGMVPHTKLKPFFDTHNIGVSYIPITDYFDFQPPTKTFEYVLSGLFCIATKTFSNKEIINDENGILINDNSEDFANAIERIIRNRISLDDNKIRKTLYAYTWNNIVNRYLEPIINPE